MHLPGRLWRSTKTRIADLFRWIGDYFAYLFGVFTAGVVLVLVLIEMLSALIN
ncbi:MAG TPA: hypothetical protein VFB12_01930 [Ktedonobacteraceae bacterium]|nr:hypothetical protein [Ktedonobacteraceae bacterium]